MKLLYQAGYKLYIQYFNGIIVVAETAKAAIRMLKYNKRSNFNAVRVVRIIKENTSMSLLSNLTNLIRGK